jgi:hypothetical protein
LLPARLLEGQVLAGGWVTAKRLDPLKRERADHMLMALGCRRPRRFRTLVVREGLASGERVVRDAQSVRPGARVRGAGGA